MKKNQTSLNGDIEEKILSMYAKGMSTSDIESHIRAIYGLCVSDTTISRKILSVMKEWQVRPLESICAVVFLDAIHFHVRSEGQIIKKAVYIAIGVQMDGIRDQKMYLISVRSYLQKSYIVSLFYFQTYLFEAFVHRIAKKIK